jgi:aspartate racemase
MKTIGMIGGLSWQSSALYYRYINEEINRKMGENHSARLYMYSFNFQEIASLQKLEQWDDLCQKMIESARILESSDVDLIVICSNTMHRCYDKIKDKISIPILHIVDSVGRHLHKSTIKKAGLLGTRYLLHTSLYQDIIKKQFNIQVIIPPEDQIELINHLIYTELVKGIIRNDSREKILEVIKHMIGVGIEAIILGCTEIPMLIRQDDCPIPVVDTTYLHAMDAVHASLEQKMDN